MPRTHSLKRTPVAAFREQLQADDFISLLSQTTLFRLIPIADLPLTTLEELCTAADIITLKRNQKLELDPVNGNSSFIYEILSGYVKIYDRAFRISDRRREPKDIPPALLAWRVPGELLGDFQFASTTPRDNDHIVATDECRLLQIPASLARKLGRSYPQLFLNIASNLVSKASKSRVRAQILRLPSIPSMVAMLFAELCKERGFDPTISNAQVINGTFRIVDIAAFLGYKSNSTQHAVHDLIDLGLISRHKNRKSGRFEIHGQERLQHYVAEQRTKHAEAKVGGDGKSMATAHRPEIMTASAL